MPTADVPTRLLEPRTPNGGWSRSLDPIAQHRAGIVTSRDLREAGWSPSAVDGAVRNGRLHRIAPGVFRTDGAPFSRLAARHAALAVVPNAVIARRSAAELHGLAEHRRGPVELLLPHRYRTPTPMDDLFRAERTRSLRDDEACEVDGLAATTPARTLLDLAARMSSDRLVEIAAAAVRLRACTTEEVVALLEHHPRAHGRRRLREALDLLDAGAERSRSDVEVGALAHLVEAGLPTPVLGLLVRDHRGRVIAELDLAYPELKIAIEVDGFAWHSSPGRKRADEERQNRLVLAGWTVLRFGAADVRHRPQHVVETIRSALEAATERG